MKRRTILTYHFDSSSPHVSRIFPAHSLDTSPNPLKRGSSLSLINKTQKRITEVAMLARRMNGNITIKFKRFYWERKVLISISLF